MIPRSIYEHQSYASYKQQKTSAMHLRRGSVDLGTIQEKAKEKNNIGEIMSRVAERKKQANPVGKIRRNSCANTSENQQTQQYFVDIQSQCNSSTLKKYHDEIMSKIRASQLSSYNSRPLQLVNPNSEAQTQTRHKNEKDYSRMVSSIAGKYELKLDVVLGSYQTRKQQIDDKIGMLRKHRAVSIADDGLGHVAEQRQEQTPKFAHSLTKTKQLKSQLKLSKLNRGPRWLEFMSALRRQIQLQQRLRTAKHMINQADKAQIISILSQISINPHPDIVTLESQEFDPFFKPEHKLDRHRLEAVAKELAEAWQNCESHWRKSLKNRFEIDLLQKIYTELQGEKEKGAVSLKGFVRELGVMFQNQKYLRNRDLFRIYKRIWPFSRQKFIAELGIRR